MHIVNKNFLRKTILLFAVLSLIEATFCFSQVKTLKDKGSKKRAKTYFKYGNYQQALKEYEKLLKKDSFSVEYNYKLGLCYLNSNKDKYSAIKHLEWVTRQKKFPSQVWYDLGVAHMHTYKFDEAIESFKKFLSIIKNDYNYIPAIRQIQMCKNAKELVANPVNVRFLNMKVLNSKAPDFNPYVNLDENFIVFNTKREDNIGKWIDFDGFYTSDIMYSTKKDNGHWLEPKRFPITINTPIVEEVVGFSADGSHMLIYMENQIAIGHVYLSIKQGRNYSRPTPLGENINIKKKMQTSAFLSPDKNILFFSMHLPDSYGDYDIYYSRKQADGKWGPPINAGPVINTPYDEEFPYIAPDGKTFYFASIGHNSMGGYDIFKCTWNSETMEFSQPQNIGYPLNTPEDNYTISFSKSGRYAYIAARRDDSVGDLDIYKVIFQDVEPSPVIIEGFVLNTFLEPIANAELLVYDSEKNEKIGKYHPNPTTSKFTISLLPGKYTITCYAPKYQIKILDITIAEDDSFSNKVVNIIMEKE